MLWDWETFKTSTVAPIAAQETSSCSSTEYAKSMTLKGTNKLELNDLNNDWSNLIWPAAWNWSQLYKKPRCSH